MSETDLAELRQLAAGSTTRIVAIANQKGGVGKTTTAINLGAALAELGRRTLLVDLDPQGNASTGLGVEREQRRATSYDLLLDDRMLSDVVQATACSGLWICPANGDLASADLSLAARDRRVFQLKDALARDGETLASFDHVLIDCPPTLGLLTLNAMVAAHAVLLPLQSEFFALEGLSQLMLTIREVRATANPGLRVEGVLLTMSDARNRLAQQVEADARETLGDLVFQTVVPRNVRISEAPSHGQPVLAYDSQSKGAQSYRALARELLARRVVEPVREGRS